MDATNGSALARGWEKLIAIAPFGDAIGTVPGPAGSVL